MTNSNINKREVKCPQCGRLAFYSPENPYRPFCSERCRLIDLGEWASGNYAIPVTKESEEYQEADDGNNDERGESEGSHQ